jgi:hypothetical protein
VAAVAVVVAVVAGKLRSMRYRQLPETIKYEFYFSFSILKLSWKQIYTSV